MGAMGRERVLRGRETVDPAFSANSDVLALNWAMTGPRQGLRLSHPARGAPQEQEDNTPFCAYLNQNHPKLRKGLSHTAWASPDLAPEKLFLAQNRKIEKERKKSIGFGRPTSQNWP